MKVRANCKESDKLGLLKLWEVYTVMDEDGTAYLIYDETKRKNWYNKTRFEKVEEVMKIKDWKELDGKTINGNVICVDDTWINLENKDGYDYFSIDMEFSTTEQITSILKVYGIEVEFEKGPTITQEEHDFAQWLYTRNKNATISRNLTYNNWRSGCIEWADTKSYFKEFNIGMEHCVSDLLKMKVEG